MLSNSLIEESGAKKWYFVKAAFLSQESTEGNFFWQVLEGIIKMTNYSKEDQEFTQGMFITG